MTDTEKNMTDTEKETALRYYLSHKKSMREYQQRNKEKTKERNQKYLEELKDDPERRQKYLDKKREYYLNHTKPKNEAKKTTAISVAVL